MSYSDLIINDGPVAYWRLGESSGTTAADEMGNHAGTYVNSPTLGVAGALVGDTDTAVDLDGANDYINTSLNSTWINDNHSLLTIEGWFQYTGGASYAALWGTRSTGLSGGMWMARQANGTLQFTLAGIADYPTNYTVPSNQWVHIVAVRNGTSFKLYVNGSLQDSFAVSSSLNSTNTDFVIGARATHEASTTSWDGRVDEFAVYTSELTATQVQAHYEEGRNTNYKELITDAAPIAYWTLDETSGTTMVDEMGNHDGTYVNSPTLGQFPGITTGTSVRFTRTSSERVDVAVSDTSLSGTANGYTMEGWFKHATLPTSNDTRMWYMSKGIPGTAEQELVVGIWESAASAGRANIFASTDWGNYVSSVRPSTNEWFHLAVTVSTISGTANLKIYIDGIEEASQTVDYEATTGDFGIAHRSDHLQHFDGWADEVAIYNRALTPEEIEYHYDVGVGNEVYVPGQQLLSGNITLDASTIEGAVVTVVEADDDEGTNASVFEVVTSNENGDWSTTLPLNPGKVYAAFAQYKDNEDNLYTSVVKPYLTVEE